MLEYDASEKQGNRGYLQLRGELAGDSPQSELKRALEHHYIDDGVRSIVIDLAGVTRISLEGVAVLLELKRESTDRGKRLIVENPKDEVREKLVITGVMELLTEP